MNAHTTLPPASKSPAPSAATDALTIWNGLMAAYDAAKAADDDINARYDAAREAYNAEKPAEPEIDLALLGLTFLGSDEIVLRRLLYADDLDDMQAKIIGATGVTRWERVNRDPQRIAEIDKARTFRQLDQDSRGRHGLAALEDHWEATGQKLADARNALLVAAAPDYAAVRWKLDQLFGPDATGPVADEGRGIPCWDCELTDAVIADMARLGGAA